MDKKRILWYILYYILTLIIYTGFFYSSSLIMDLSGDDLGSVMAMTYAVLFVGTPALIVLLMRFSLLRWYVDPIASAEIPLFLYGAMAMSQMKHTEDFLSALSLINIKLGDDGGMGWLFLAGLFIFGLAASFSIERKHCRSISYRFLSRIKGRDDTSQCAN